MAKIIPLKEFKEIKPSGRYSITHEYYRFISKSDGRRLKGSIEKELFDMLKDVTKGGETFVTDYTWLQDRFDVCQRTIRRTLHKFSDLFTHKLKRFSTINGVAQFCKLRIKRTASFDQIIKTAAFAQEKKLSLGEDSLSLDEDSLSLDEDNLSGGKDNLSVSIYKNNKDINKDISCVKTRAREEEQMKTTMHDEIFLVCEKQEYSSTGEKEEEHVSDFLEQLKEQEYSNKEYVDDSEEEQAEIDALDLQVKEMESERSMPKYALNRDCELELNYELSKAFDLETYSRTIKQITFSYDKNSHKLTLIHDGPLTLSANQKECLKTISAKVYGEGVALSSRARVKNEKLGTESQKSIINDSGIALWEKVKNAMKQSKGEPYVRSWLLPLAPRLDEENKKLFISGPIFFLSFIQRDLEPVLEAVMKSEGYTCDLLGYERGEEKLVASVPFVKFFPQEGQSASDISVNLKRW